MSKRKKNEELELQAPDPAPEPEQYIIDRASDPAEPARPASGVVEFSMENRTSVRKAIRVITIAQFKESENETWKEITEIRTISKNGAGLVLSRPCPVGRLISLVMEMPPELRLYDHFAPVYPMLAIVQNCSEAIVGDKPIFHVGVAFVGKKLPSGFKANPKQCYRISGLNADGLWNIVESGRAFQARKHARYWRQFEVTISVRDEKKRKSQRKKVITRDVSLGGMSVWGPLEANIGDRIKIVSKDYDFYSMATVRNRTDDETNESRSMIHFEFDGAEFPVEKVHLPVVAAEPAIEVAGPVEEPVTIERAS